MLFLYLLSGLTAARKFMLVLPIYIYFCYKRTLLVTPTRFVVVGLGNVSELNSNVVKDFLQVATKH